MTTAFPSIEEEIRYKLSHRKKLRISDPEWTPASVLIVILEKHENTHVLFTKRTEVVEYHKGQICFPGGGCEANETRRNTALRESFEEIGLKPEDVEILGELDDAKTVTSHFIITPFVAHIRYPYDFTPSKIEISEIILLPLDELRDNKKWKVERSTQDDGTESDVYFVEVNGSVVWGATAKILKQLVDILNG